VNEFSRRLRTWAADAAIAAVTATVAATRIATFEAERSVEQQPWSEREQQTGQAVHEALGQPIVRQSVVVSVAWLGDLDFLVVIARVTLPPCPHREQQEGDRRGSLTPAT
jgi:hypothetical protein